MTEHPSLLADPETLERAQLDRLRRWDFRQYDMSDDRQRAVVEELLVKPLARTKRW